MSDPPVSVVIPCYNSEEHVEECIEQVYSQTYPQIEVIAVNDGSTDDTLPILRSLKQKYSDLTLLNGSNEGAPRARNRGLEKAQGKYIQFLDADDLLKPTKIEHQVQRIHSSDDPVELIASSYVRRRLSGQKQTISVGKRDPWAALLRSRLGITSANLYRTSAVRRVGGWSTDWRASQDAELSFRLLKGGAEVVLDDHPLTIKQDREDSINMGNQERRLKYSFKVRALIMQHLRRSNMLDEREHLIDYDWMFRFWQQYYHINREDALNKFEHVFPDSFLPNQTRQGAPPVTRLYQLLVKFSDVQVAQRAGAFQDRIIRGVKRRLGLELN